MQMIPLSHDFVNSAFLSCTRFLRIPSFWIDPGSRRAYRLGATQTSGLSCPLTGRDGDDDMNVPEEMIMVLLVGARLFLLVGVIWIVIREIRRGGRETKKERDFYDDE